MSLSKWENVLRFDKDGTIKLEILCENIMMIYIIIIYTLFDHLMYSLSQNFLVLFSDLQCLGGDEESGGRLRNVPENGNDQIGIHHLISFFFSNHFNHNK